MENGEWQIGKSERITDHKSRWSALSKNYCKKKATCFH